MNKKQVKRRRDMKTKLMAAICMLLVSSIMMVSTTYAWFTLSTAPEVTGINTAVGANGNLEMALLPATGDLKLITSSDGDSVKAANLRNVTWGNLVDVSDNTFYGMDNIMLYPAALNVATWDVQDDTVPAAHKNPATIAEAMLKTPAYGADGRVSELLANTVTSTYDTTETSFPVNTNYGVRAVGTASGMTPRQLAYRNYRSDASTAMNQAKVFASQSLSSNGAALANIAMAHAVDSSATHTQDDVTALKAIVTDLVGNGGNIKGVLRYIEDGYKNYIIALGASAASQTAGLTDEAFTIFANSVTGATDTSGNGTNLDEIKGLLASNHITLDTVMDGAIDELVDTIEVVLDAQDDLEALTGDSIAWADISVPLNKLAITNSMEVNGVPVKDVKDKMMDVFSVMSSGGGLTVTISTGGGVYADVADHCGDFNAEIILSNIKYGDYDLSGMKARMQTNTTVDNSYGSVYLTLMATAVNLAGSPAGTGTTMPISDFYGYIIDLAFRTNAAESNLLLQQTAEDRIYEGSNGVEINSEVGGVQRTESTMGHGATMEFTSADPNFSVDQMKGLMRSIRIVFFDPDTRNVVATAKLDVDNATVVGSTVTATIYLYTNTAGGGYAETTFDAEAQAAAQAKGTPIYFTQSESYEVVPTADAATFAGQLFIEDAGVYNPTSYTDDTQTYYKKVVSYVAYNDAAAPADGTKLYAVQGAGEVRKTDNVIMPLTQNQAQKLSVLVYLDGENVQNKDVAVGDSSMTGKMNLQFSSSATLTPMNYTQLMPQGNNNVPETTGAAGG